MMWPYLKRVKCAFFETHDQSLGVFLPSPPLPPSLPPSLPHMQCGRSVEQLHSETGLSGIELKKFKSRQKSTRYVHVCVCVCTHVHVRARVHVNAISIALSLWVGERSKICLHVNCIFMHSCSLCLILVVWSVLHNYYVHVDCNNATSLSGHIIQEHVVILPCKNCSISYQIVVYTT